jgi:hypothetical protein
MKFMLLQDYYVPDVEPMSRWAPEEITAHIDFQRKFNDELRELGELVEAQALTQVAKTVVHDGGGSPVVTDGPFVESKELLAGYRTVDVESLDRALEIAARASAAPGPGGRPVKQPIEVREVMDASGIES